VCVLSLSSLPDRRWLVGVCTMLLQIFVCVPPLFLFLGFVLWLGWVVARPGNLNSPWRYMTRWVTAIWFGLYVMSPCLPDGGHQQYQHTNRKRLVTLTDSNLQHPHYLHQTRGTAVVFVLLLSSDRRITPSSYRLLRSSCSAPLPGLPVSWWVRLCPTHSSQLF